jgi:hypothetical protein
MEGKKKDSTVLLQQAIGGAHDFLISFSFWFLSIAKSHRTGLVPPAYGAT